jgi:hypothetical protein
MKGNLNMYIFLLFNVIIGLEIIFSSKFSVVFIFNI